MHRFRHWSSASLTAALIVVAGGVLTSSAASTGASAFVPIAPCRLFDTRPAPDTVGARTAPLGPGETYTVPTWGPNGNCTLPTGITGISANVTVIGGTAGSFLTVFPADTPRPVTANLNWVGGQAPTPNAVTAALSATGTLSFYNLAGTVHVAVDIVGYYEPTNGGPPGPAGPQGPAGPAGPRGFSAWDVIPSGVTVKGSIFYDESTTGNGSSDYISVALPGIAPSPLVTGNVNFRSDANPLTADDDPSCTGSYGAPTAPTGKVCIYANSIAGGTDFSGTAVSGLPDHGFEVIFTPGAGVVDLYFYATWAYRAP